VAGGAFAAIAYHPAIDPVTPPPPDPAMVRRGAVLATIGDCAVCHTAAHGAAYAGGRPLPTPFGIIYSSNITPDPDTGIGRWSLAAFTRAIRQGISRDGANLYPALPYEHFTKMSDGDVAALYAYFTARPPVHAERPANELPFPLGWRPLLAGWNLLFFDPGRFTLSPAHDAEWNRGAYLTEAVAHCGACHTPRNALGAEQHDHPYEGGKAEGWIAPALAGAPWTADSLFTYLRTGVAAGHGAAAGPMAPVWWNLARAPEADVHAIATYIASFAGPIPPPPHEDAAAAANLPGAALFAGACASCHGPAAPMMQAGAPALTYSTAVHADHPDNAVRVILGGIRPEQYRAGPQMPAFRTILTDEQIADIAAYLRARYAPGTTAWTGLPAAVHHLRGEGDAS
jgi:nicotinate dehydrogenase subunit B